MIPILRIDSKGRLPADVRIRIRSAAKRLAHYRACPACLKKGGLKMLDYLKKEANYTVTENGAVTYKTTNCGCLDLFAAIGAMRQADETRILELFQKAWAENRDLAVRIVFYARDIRGGLGERRIILKYLAVNEPETVRKNLSYISEFGRFDDLLVLEGTVCWKAAAALIREQLKKDLDAVENERGTVSLLAKWLPSVNASCDETRAMGKRVAKELGMRESQYRHMLARLRTRIGILENFMREMEYTFSYEKQPSRAMYRYRKAFIRNDGERYCEYIGQVVKGEARMNTGTLYPYDIISPLTASSGQKSMEKEERKALDAAWNALTDYTNGENALVVIDGSGSMYWNVQPSPASAALSLGIYFAERNKGRFKNHSITFSERPQMVEIKGRDIVDKVRYCESYNEVANTNLQAVFELIFQTAVKYRLKQEEMPERLYIVSDMEFDSCTQGKSRTNFEAAIYKFRSGGYKLPEVVFWNVAARNIQNPVTMNEQGVSLISGCTPKLFEMAAQGVVSPYERMMEVLGAERFRVIAAS